jgi:hypothetical protein
LNSIVRELRHAIGPADVDQLIVHTEQQQGRDPLSDKIAVFSLASAVEYHGHPDCGKGGLQPRVCRQLRCLPFHGAGDSSLAVFLGFLTIAMVIQFRHGFSHRSTLIPQYSEKPHIYTQGHGGKTLSLVTIVRGRKAGSFFS